MLQVVTQHRRPSRKVIATLLAWPLREKWCPGCERTRPVERFYVLKKWPCGMPYLYQSYCKDCQADARRYQQGMKNIGRPYRPRREGMSHEEYLAVRRDQYAQKKQDPAWVANRRAKANAAAKRRRERKRDER